MDQFIHTELRFQNYTFKLEVAKDGAEVKAVTIKLIIVEIHLQDFTH